MTRQISWTEPSIRRVSSSRVWLVVGKKPNPWATYPVADLALEVAGGWWTRFAQIPFGLQLLNASYFELFYSWLACKTPTSSVHRECFQFRGCDATLSHCALQTVLVSLVLPTRTPEAMMKLPIEYLLGNSCVIHTNDMSTPSELCSLQKCLNSTDVPLSTIHVWIVLSWWKREVFVL